jgi:mRNA-capping enzyme
LKRDLFIYLSGVHCTYGFNRTGFLICTYLCRENDMSIDATIDLFSKARQPGIYKQDYLTELLRKYGDESSVSIPEPPRSDWCLSKTAILCLNKKQEFGF